MEKEDPSSPGAFKPFACQSCVRRKVRCDRVTPSCSSCTKASFECLYREPPPPRARSTKRKRVMSGGNGDQDMWERLQQYERILQQSGLLHPAELAETPLAPTQASPISPSYKDGGTPSILTEPEPAIQPRKAAEMVPEELGHVVEGGKLLASQGRSRYINSQIWLDAGDTAIAEMSEHDQDHEHEHDHEKKPGNKLTTAKGQDVHAVPLEQDILLCGTLLGTSQSLLAFHPSPDHALRLWAIYANNVEPLCKVLHTPTMARLVESISQQPSTVAKAQECLLFSVYHCAIVSLDDAECHVEFSQPRAWLLRTYEHATRQALVNASWLRTTELSVLQAYVLLLIAMRGRIDPHTFWIWTGVAVRIAQRMGLHRDGQAAGLCPFDVEMRRRLFWQLAPLDSYAGQISGTGIAITPSSWDTKQPLNLDDNQIHPGMTTPPLEKRGASDMLFCQTRAELSNLYARTGVKTRPMGPTVDLRENAELEKLIDETEDVIETKYLRYCDLLDPLHILTLGVVRSAINVVRLRNRITPLLRQAITDGRRRELCVIAQKILQTDSALHRDPNLRGFRWQIKTHFLWDSLICVLMSLAKPGFFSLAELNDTWSMLAEVYANHSEIMEGKGAIQISIGKATITAWRANPRPGPDPAQMEPVFIQKLRQLQQRKDARGTPRISKAGHVYGTDTCVDSTTVDSALTSNAENGPGHDGAEAVDSLEMLFGNRDGMEFQFESFMNMEPADCVFWSHFPQPDGTFFA